MTAINVDGNNKLISECFFLEGNFLISCFTIFISHGCYTEHNRANNHQESLYIPIDTEISEGKGISSSHGWLIHALISKRPIISSFKQPWQWHHLLTKAEVTANIHTHFCLIFIALRHFLLSYLFDICLLSTVIDFYFFLSRRVGIIRGAFDSVNLIVFFSGNTRLPKPTKPTTKY